jgi:acyl carrier protein
MRSREEILAQLTEHLEEMFEVPPERVTPEARLYEDLDLDSIDAVDLVVKLQEVTGKRIRPETFKAVRTVGDVVECMHAILAE